MFIITGHVPLHVRQQTVLVGGCTVLDLEITHKLFFYIVCVIFTYKHNDLFSVQTAYSISSESQLCFIHISIYSKMFHLQLLYRRRLCEIYL